MQTKCPLFSDLFSFCLLGIWTIFAFPAWCHSQEPAWHWVREGIAFDHGPKQDTHCEIRLKGQPIPVQEVRLNGGRRWLKFAWLSGQNYEIRLNHQHYQATTPQRPTPWNLYTFSLEDVSSAATAGVAPDAVVKFAPDSRRFAVGSYGGWLRVMDALSGETLHQERISEGMVKRLAWSPDGKQLYAGEQSPDAELFALDTETYERLWSLRLADTLETSRPPANDIYGRYTLPAVFDLQVSQDGRIFAAGLHSWADDAGLHNRSQLWSVSDTGEILWRYPAEGAAPVTIPSFGMDVTGQRLAFFAQQSQPAVENNPIPPGILYLLHAQSGKLLDAYSFQPQRHFQRVESWDSVTVSADGARAAIGLSDGRAFLFAVEEGDEPALGSLRLLKQLDLGSPVTIGQIPIVAACSYARFHGDQLFLQTQNTHIPFGSPLTALQPPTTHRGANTLTVTNREGQRQWLYRGPFSLTGSWSNIPPQSSAAPRWLLTTCRELPGAPEPSQFGALLFDLSQSGGGRDRLNYYYPTSGPVFSHADISPDGRLFSLIEIPTLPPGKRDLMGKYQVHIVH